MPAITEWDATAFLLTSTGQPEPITWSTLLEKLQEAIPVPWVWVAFPLIVVALLFILDIGDKLSGIFGWLGIESPFLRTVLPDSGDEQRIRRTLLRKIKLNIDTQLESSLHKGVKIDLDIEDQPQQIGKRKIELIPEDDPEVLSIFDEFLIRRDFQSFTSQAFPLIALEQTQKTIDVFDQRDVQGQLLILGELGAGKTTELLHLAQDLLKRACEDENFPIPVLLELATWDEEKSLEEWLANSLSKPKQKGGYGIDKRVANQWLQNDAIIPLLDGLDEIGLIRQRKCIKAINTFLVERSPHGLVVCCRREEYEAAQIQIDALKGAIYLKPLWNNQIKGYFQKLKRLSMWESIQANPKTLALARKPLFLVMLVEAYQGNRIANDSELLDAFIAKRFERTTTDVYPLKKKPDSQQTLNYLAWLAKNLENDRKNWFFIEGLQPSLLSRHEGETELYAAIITSIGFFIFAWIIGLAFFLRGWLNFKMGDEVNNALFLGLSFGLAFIVQGAAFILRSGKWLAWLSSPIQPSEKLSFSFSKGLNSLRIGLRAGLVFGLFFGITFGVLSGPSMGLSFGLTVGVIYGLIVGLLLSLYTGLRAELIDERDFPNQGIWQSLQNSLISGLIIGLIFGIFFGLIAGLTAGLIAGIVFGMILGMASGLEAVIRHIALRIVLTKNSYIPWNYARFLDYAVELRFIQRVGGRYRFVHILLRKHFAEMSLR